jgi:serine protease
MALNLLASTDCRNVTETTMKRRLSRLALPAFALALAASLAAASALAQSVTSLRVMLNPSFAPKGTLSDAAREKLEALAGMSLTQIGSTRTGAVELGLSTPLDETTAAKVLQRMRSDRNVLWAERPLPRAKSTSPKAAAETGNKMFVRLKDDGADVAAIVPQLSATLGVPLAVERKIGHVFVLSTLQSQNIARLEQLAEMLQQNPAVQYADPVRRAYVKRVPNDPLFAQQWALTDPVAGINAPLAWNVQTGSPAMVIGIVDTGILAHPDLDGRVIAGYDFISDARAARDGDGRDSNPADEGDWVDAGDCGFEFFEPSSWHGTFVAGVIAANSDNGIGIAGVNWASKILPVRALGKCGGTFDDILAGMLWASGVQIDGVPFNTTPAKVINMSLGGFGGCDQSFQEAVDEAVAQGAVISVAAGNESADATTSTPANCSGVITVGATGRTGDRASYSNFGRRVDISAPGGDIPFKDENLIVSLSNTGTTTPKDPTYAYEAGTSFAAPLVAGTASLILARNPMLTSGQVFSIMENTARPFASGSTCDIVPTCGPGILDAGVAVTSTAPAISTPPQFAVTVVEYYRADLDHYFMTASIAEQNYVDTYLPMFQRTGLLFYAYPEPFFAPPSARPVCRFYAAGLINSHFFTASQVECQYVLNHYPGIWKLEDAATFYIQVPDNNGVCPDNTLPVYRFFDNRNDANHRYTVDLSVRRAMLNRGWVPEGNGPNGVVFCSPF